MAKHLPTLVRQTPAGEEGGAVSVASAELRRGWWDVHSAFFPNIATAAIKLLSFHVTSCATERNWSVWGRLCTKTTNRRVLERAAKLITVMTSSTGAAAANAEEELLALLSKEL
jgi:hAT family C-terminal dimerisation region